MNYKHTYYCAMRKRSQIIRLPILIRLRAVFEFYIRIESVVNFMSIFHQIAELVALQTTVLVLCVRLIEALSTV